MRMRKALRKIHRWIGMISAVWLLQLATTGLLLQHAEDLKLTTSYVSSPAILQWFDYGKRQLAWDSEGEVFYQIDDAIGFSNFKIDQAEKIMAAVKIKQEWWAASAQSIYRYNQQGELVMQLDDFDGLATPIDKVALHTDYWSHQSAGQWFEVDSNGMTLKLNHQPSEIVQARELGPEEKNIWLPRMLGNQLSYDKVLHGIHSGIKSSNWLNSLSALALFYLCFSGLYLFFKQPKSKRIS